MSEGINGYISVGNIFVDFTDIPDNAVVKNYYRDLNLDDSVAHVRYEYDNKEYSREYFASHPKQTLVFRCTGDELNFNVNPVSMHPGEVTVNDGEITIIGKLKDSEPYSSGGNAAWNQESDLEYCTKVKVIADNGTVTDSYNSVNVSGANLLDSGKSLIGWFNSQIPAGRITAKNMYGVTPKSYTYSDGKITFTDSADDADDVFIMHTKQAIMGTTDMTGSTSIQSAGNTAWLMYNLWDLYQTTGDKELLENDLYPIMRKAANFYTQYIYTNERKTTSDTTKYTDGYYYTTWAGRSPEQGPTEEGIKYDLQLVAGMYDTIAAAKTLNVDADKIAAWEEIRNHLEAPVELGEDGQIKEWKEETTYNRDANGNAIGGDYHRHISHLVGLYPGTLINRDTSEWLEGAKIVLENRGDGATGWSTSNKFLLWARTLEGDKALDLFRFQLAHRTYANLFDYHSPFQIDGNFGSAAGVMELLMQSQTGTVYILPALPSLWDKGEISGIKAKNGAEISIKWENNEAAEFTVTPAVDGDIKIGYDQEHTSFTMNGTINVDFSDGTLYTIENAEAGQTYTFTPIN